MKTNYVGPGAIVKKDEWDFTMAKFTSLVPHGYKSFALLIHCDEVFFSNNDDEPRWKVVL